MIDDDADDRELFGEALKEQECQTVYYTAEGGEEAFSLMNDNAESIPDLIFLDVNMPGMSGWECLEILKAEEAYSNIPVIMYSTSSQRNDVSKAKKLGALAFLSKPYDFEELIGSLGLVISHLEKGTLKSLVLSSSVIFCLRLAGHW